MPSEVQILKESKARFEGVIFDQTADLGTNKSTSCKVIDEATGVVIAQSGGGGGGDESDFTTAEVKFINSAENKSYLIAGVPILDTVINNSIICATTEIGTEDTFTVVLYKGKLLLPGQCIQGTEAVMPVLTGDIEITEAGFAITGNCTISCAGTRTPN